MLGADAGVVAGASSPAAPLNTFLPGGKVTMRALAVLVPSLARRAWTVTSSPTLRSFFRQPRRTRINGRPGFELPLFDARVGFGVDVDPGVRIHPLDFGDITFYVDV